MGKDEHEDKKSPDDPETKGMTRRGFLTSVGASAAGIALSERLGA